MKHSQDSQSGFKLPKNLGVAGGMAKTFIHSPLSPLFLTVCVFLGFMGLVFTPRQEDPQISVPMVDVFVSYPGATPAQVSSLVTEPLERILSEIQGVKHVYSASMHEKGMVTVEYDVGEDMVDSVSKLNDKIKSNMDKIPPGVHPPLIKPRAVDDVPVVALTLWSSDVDDSLLRQLALDLLQRLKEVPNSSEASVVGGRSEQIRVEVFPERLSGYGISLGQIANTIVTNNTTQGAGSMESGGAGFKVYSGAFIRTPDEISRLQVGTSSFGQPIHVRDVATVTIGPEETRQMVTYSAGQSYDAIQGVKRNGDTPEHVAAVTIAIAKKKGSNGVTVANDILAKVEELKGNLIPANVHVSVTRNYGETANEKVNELLFKLVVATGAVMLMVWYSLGFKPAVVVLVVIPIVILMTVFSAFLLGYTIDRVSLFALIFSIGILVDDAIVVVENIYRRWLLVDASDWEISVDAVREVGNPTILATFTVIAALLPMGFVRGMMGPYMEPIPALGSVAMLLSLFAAFIFTPWLAQRIRPSMHSLEAASRKEHAQTEKMEKFYRKIITPLVQEKKKGYSFLVFLLVTFFASMLFFVTTDVTVKILPLDNKPEFNVVINMPEGTALPRTANLAQRMTQVLRDNLPEVTALQTYVGTASPFNFNGMVRHYYLRSEPWQADIQVQLLHKSKRKRTSHDLAVAARALLTPMAAAEGGKVQVVEMPPGPPVLQSVVAEVTGPDQATRHQVAWKMTELFEQTESIVDVDNYMEEPYFNWRFEPDTQKASRHKVSVDDINKNMSMAMGGYKLGDIKREGVLEPIYIVLQLPLTVRANITSLGDLPIPSQAGSTVPLSELGQFVKQPQKPVVYHKDLRPVEYVTGEVTGRLDAPIYGMMDVEEMLKSYTTPDGVTGMSGTFTGPPDDWHRSGFEWTGEWTVTYETFRDMGLAFGAALILIYMLVVWEFGNFTLPAIIMAPIPLTLIGIVPGHWLLDARFTATSMIGFIALAGIIVRNSILLVDFSQQEILKGTPVLDAVILSCKARTRPILITAFALVAGSSVIITDFIFQGMAISLLFGVLVSTVLTLVVIPLGCISAKNSFTHPETTPENEDDGMGSGDGGGVVSLLDVAKSRDERLAAARSFLERYNQPGNERRIKRIPRDEQSPVSPATTSRAVRKREESPQEEKKPAPASESGDPDPAVAPVAAPAAAEVVPQAVKETPSAEAPVAEAPAEETPVVEAPVGGAPAEETPVAETPVAETPVAEALAVETPAVEALAVETPVVEAPAVEAPEEVEASAVDEGTEGDVAAEDEVEPSAAPAAQESERGTRRTPGVRKEPVAKGTTRRRGIRLKTNLPGSEEG